MSWITVIWSMSVSACLMLALVHASVWWQRREAQANGLFALLALAVIAYLMAEFWMLKAGTIEEFGRAVRFSHVPAFVGILSLLGIVRIYLRAGRLWLAWIICGLRVCTLILNSFLTPNINFREITTLHHIRFLGESVTVVEGVPNPWMLVPQISLLLLLIFAVDAMLTVWRRGDRTSARWLSGAIAFFISVATGMALLHYWTVAPIPATLGVSFWGIVVAMGFELSRDVIRGARLTADLKASEEKFHTLFENAGDAIFLLQDGRFVECNARTPTMFGCQSRDQILGHTPGEFSPHCQPSGRNSQELATEKLSAALAGQPHFFEWMHTKLDGTPFPAEVSLNRVQLGEKMLVQAIVRDVTERKRAEAALRQSEQLYRNLFELESDALLLLDAANHDILDCNQAAQKLYGYSREEFLKLRAEDISAEPEKTRQIIGTGTYFVPVRWHRKKDGTRFPVETAANSLQFKGRRAELAAVRDVTERQRAETKLRRNETQLRAILESTADGILAVDNDGERVIASNRRFGELWKIPQSLVDTGDNRVLLDFVRDQLSDPDAFLKKAMPISGTKVLNWETLAFKDGRIFEHHGFPILLDGAVIGRVSSFRDITQRKRAEEELRESEAKLRAMFNGARDAMSVSKEGVRVLANPAFLKLFGCQSLDEVAGTSALAFVAPSHHAQIAEIIERRARGGAVPSYYETRGRRTDGTEFDEEVSVATYEVQGEKYSVAVIRDITERKRVEAELNKHRNHLEELVKERTAELQQAHADTEAAYRKLVELEKLRDDLVHMVVHDMRSPLAGLGMFLDSLSPEEVNAPDFTETVRLMQEASHALSGMVTSLLDVSRLEAGQMPLHCEASDLGQLAIAAQQRLSGLILGRQVSVRTPISPVFAHCDPIITERIFQNLLGNALKFTPMEGMIRIDLATEGPWARFSITDTGPGIPVEYHEKVFHKFGQVELRKNRKVPSSGLGLAFCKLAVEAQRGNIQVESELGHGSTFHVRLPGHAP